MSEEELLEYLDNMFPEGWYVSDISYGFDEPFTEEVIMCGSSKEWTNAKD